MRSHDFDPLSFTFGLLFAAAGLVLLGGGLVPHSLDIPWVGPVIAIGVGVLIVIAARPRGEPPRDEASADPDESAASLPPSS